MQSTGLGKRPLTKISAPNTSPVLMEKVKRKTFEISSEYQGDMDGLFFYEFLQL